jgi:anti-sigma factor ChrR (cupin superfamily)
MKPYDPRDIERPGEATWERLAQRLYRETGLPPPRPPQPAPEPAWEDVAPGIQVKILAKDAARHRVSMLVRLAPNTDYPPHTHAGVEELHLLHGELWIDDRKLVAGDYNRAEPGTGDKRVWSETGCTCVLVTSPDDVLG